MRPIASGASLAAATNVVSSPGLSQIFVIASKSGRRVLVCISVHPRTSWQAAETAASWKATSIGSTGMGAVDRKCAVQGRGGSERGDLGGVRIITKKYLHT